MSTADDDPITDWSLAGRKRLIAERGDEIRYLLDEAFTTLVQDGPGLNLSAFGFHAEDPAGEAVEWSMRRFATADLDENRIHRGSRGFRLFTETRFWLCQKVGRTAYDRIMAEARAGEPIDSASASDAQAPREEIDTEVSAFGQTLAETLRTLCARTCADMVGFWLEGTRILRREWFAWSERGDLSPAAAASSKKQRSFHTHDAMFRFLCCFFELVPAAPDAAPEVALELTSLSGCPNQSPYRVPDRDLVGALQRFGVRRGRHVGALRKQGAASLLRRCLSRTHPPTESPRDRLVSVFTRKSLSATTLHALGIEGDPALRDQLEDATDDSTQEMER